MSSNSSQLIKEIIKKEFSQLIKKIEADIER